MALGADKAIVQAALAAANGDRKVAAHTLGWSAIRLRDFIKNNPDLDQRWGKQAAKPVTDVQTIARDPVVTLDNATGVPAAHTESPILTREESDKLKAFEKEELRLRNNMAGMGLTEKQRTLAVSLQNFANKHFECMAGSMSAGMYRQYMLHIEQIDEVIARLAALRAEYAKGNKTRELLDEENMLLRHYHQLVSSEERLVKTAGDLSALRAKVMLWRNQVKNANAATAAEKKAKVGFPALIKIDAAAGANVTLQEAKPEPKEVAG